MLRPALRVLSAVLLWGCFSAVSFAQVVKPRVPNNEADCKAVGGNWTRLGLGMRCDIKTTDDGTTCSDSDQCQGSCMASEQTAPGTSATGKCSAYVANFGSLSFVERGRVVHYHIE